MTILLAALAGIGGSQIAHGYAIMIEAAKMVMMYTATGAGDKENEFIHACLNAFIPFCAGFALCIFLFEVLTIYTDVHNRDLSIELFTKPAIKFIIAICIITNIGPLANVFFMTWNWFLGICDGIIGDVNNPTTIGASGAIGMLARVILDGIFTTISLLSQIIAAVVLIFQCLTLKIELDIRVILLPFAMTSLLTEGMRSAGITYIKKTLACALTGGFVLIAINMVFAITSSKFASLDFLISTSAAGTLGGLAQTAQSYMWNVVFRSLVGPFAAVGSISALKSVIAEAMA